MKRSDQIFMRLRVTMVISIVLLVVVTALGCSLGPGGSGRARVRRVEPTRTPKPTFTATPAATPTPVQTNTPTPAPPPPPTDTPVPTDTPPPPPAPLEAVVNDGPVNLRQGPGTNYPRLGQANGGDRLPVLGRNQAGDWYQIRLPDGNVGWIAASLVTLSDPAAAIAVAADIPPPPTPRPVPPTNTPVPAPAPEPTSQWPVIPVGFYNGPPNPGLSRLRISIKDAAGNPVNNLFAYAQCWNGSWSACSYPTGPVPIPWQRIEKAGNNPGETDIFIGSSPRDMQACTIQIMAEGDDTDGDGQGNCRTPLSEPVPWAMNGTPDEAEIVTEWKKVR